MKNIGSSETFPVPIGTPVYVVRTAHVNTVWISEGKIYGAYKYPLRLDDWELIYFLNDWSDKLETVTMENNIISEGSRYCRVFLTMEEAITRKKILESLY